MLKNVDNPRVLEFQVSGLTSTTPAKKVCRVINHHLSTSTTTESKYQENLGFIKKLLNSPIFCTDADTIKKSLI